MAVNNEYPVLDGIAPSYAEITVKCQLINGPLLDIKDIAAINTGTSLEVGTQRGASGGRVTRRTAGAESVEASATLYRSGYQKFLRGLKDAAVAGGFVRGNQVAIRYVHFDIFVSHTPPGDFEIYEYRLKGCFFGGRTMNGAEGTDPDQVEIPLNPATIVDMIDGKEVVIL